MEQNLSETQKQVAERSGQLNELVNTIAELELQIEHLSDVGLAAITEKF